MKNILISIVIIISAFSTVFSQTNTTQGTFRIKTDNSELVFLVGKDNYLYQLDYSKGKEKYTLPARGIVREKEFYPPSGNGYISEPALMAVHADGNTSTELFYQNHETKALEDNVELTIIHLKDPKYPFYVDFFIKSFKKEDVLEMWTEIYHEENGSVRLDKYSSASPVFSAKEYFLTQFNGNYKREATVVEEKLTEGIKILDSKLGIRAHQMRIPSFILSLDKASDEENGETYLGTLSWPGSFQMAFDLDWNKNLRAITGINPFASQYFLEKNRRLRTPTSIWTYSCKGKGQASRNIHHWAVKYGVREGGKDRPILLNNWEATHTTFDENKLISLFEDAKKVGVELFLLDDGWFGNGEFARNDDKHGLGDWDVDVSKIPNGLSFLSSEAKKRGLEFGIWLEPEMVNPKSELFQKHPDWVIGQPQREFLYGRNQLILDLSRPEVQRFEWENVINKTLGDNKGISYVKWDANRYVTQPGSFYLAPETQSHLLVDYNNALLDLMKKTKESYPNVMMMLCAGGSGRTDYGSMEYFHSFWPSDNTDPLKRVYIQWGFSHIFPANTISAHVTRMGNRPLKFTIDVALSGAYGIDLDLSKLNEAELKQLGESVKLYKKTLRPIVQNGDLYRLSSPYEQNAAALSYVTNSKEKAVIFVYQVKEGEVNKIKLSGLDPLKKYQITELNKDSKIATKFVQEGKVYTGKQLMEEGIQPTCSQPLQSMIIGLNIK